MPKEERREMTMRSLTLCGLVFLGIWLGLVDTSRAEGCYDAGLVCKYKRNALGQPTTAVDANCPKLVTSLYIVNSGSPAYDDGWTAGPGLCGMDTRTGRACGDYNLGHAVCGPGVSVYPGDPFPADPDPCDPVGPSFDPEACSGGGARPPYLNGVHDPKAMTVVEHLRRVAQQSLPPYVEKAIETLGSASSLHLRARITLSSEKTGDRPVAGVYEYWEKDGKYRIHFGINLAEVPISEIAYDGRQYQMALGRASTLSVARVDERVVSSEIPNPFVLVLQPLSVATPDCSFCEIRLSDLRTLRDLRHAVTTGKSSVAPLDTPGFSMKMTRTTSGGPATSVLRKDKLGIVEQTEFSDYRTLAGTDMELPRSVKFSRTVNAEGLAARVAIQYQIDELDLNRPIDDSVFILDRSPYETIWQDDRFVRAPHCSKSPGPVVQ
jgi:hypothetical protein